MVVNMFFLCFLYLFYLLSIFFSCIALFLVSVLFSAKRNHFMRSGKSTHIPHNTNGSDSMTLSAHFERLVFLRQHHPPHTHHCLSQLSHMSQHSQQGVVTEPSASRRNPVSYESVPLLLFEADHDNWLALIAFDDSVCDDIEDDIEDDIDEELSS